MGIDKFVSSGDVYNLALLYSNMGRMYRYVAYYATQFMVSYGEYIEDEDFCNKVNFYI